MLSLTDDSSVFYLLMHIKLRADYVHFTLSPSIYQVPPPSVVLSMDRELVALYSINWIVMVLSPPSLTALTMEWVFTTVHTLRM